VCGIFYSKFNLLAYDGQIWLIAFYVN